MSQKFQSEIQLNALNNATTDTDKFLVSDSGIIKYRTGAQVLSDIGGQAALTNPVTGTGTTNYVPKFTGTSAIGNSQIYDNGTNVGIGTSSPTAKLMTITNAAGWSNWIENQDTTGNGSGLVVRAASNSGGFTMLLQKQDATSTFAVTGAGNVGIGTTSPSALLHLVPSSDDNAMRVSRNNGYVSFYDSTGVTRTGYIQFNSNTDSRINVEIAQPLTFYTSASERMRIAAAGNVGIGTTSPTYKTHIEGTGADIFLTKNTSSSSYNRSYFYNNNNIGIQLSNFGSAYPFGTEYGVGPNGSIIQSNTTSMFAIGTSGAYPLLLGTNGTERMRILSGGNVGIGTTSPTYKTDIVGNLRFSTGYLNSDNCFERVFSDAIVFANGTANLAADVILGNSNFWGYIEVEVTSTFNNQSSPGKLTKIFAAGVTPNNNIYANESRVSDAMGPVPNNVAIGDLSWDATNSRYRIPISHIVSTGNTYTVKVRMFTANASSSTGAKGVFDSISIGSTYTLTALSRQYPYYNSKLSIGTSSASAVLTLQNESGAYGTSYPFKMLSYAGTNIFRSYMDGSWNYVNEVFQVGGNSCSYIISTNSSERMRITSTGNVGIGTSSPGAKLHVVGETIVDDGTNGRITLGNASGQNDIYSTTTGFGGWKNLRLSSNELILSTGGTTERMRITSAGNVGIGTSSPGAKLHVNGNVISTGIGPGGTVGTYEIGDSSTYMWGSSSDKFIAFNISYSEQLRIDGNNGNVGIGTTTADPSAILDLSSTTKGFLPPRLSSGDIAAISSPAPGLMVYNTTTEEINVYTPTSGWRVLRYL